MKREHTISWDKVPKHRIIQLLLGLMAKMPICRRGTVVYCTFPVNNCRRTGLGLRGIGKVTERNFVSLLKKHFIALRFEHHTMKRKAPWQKSQRAENTVRKEQHW